MENEIEKAKMIEKTWQPKKKVIQHMQWSMYGWSVRQSQSVDLADTGPRFNIKHCESLSMHRSEFHAFSIYQPFSKGTMQNSSG